MPDEQFQITLIISTSAGSDKFGIERDIRDLINRLYKLENIKVERIK